MERPAIGQIVHKPKCAGYVRRHCESHPLWFEVQIVEATDHHRRGDIVIWGIEGERLRKDDGARVDWRLQFIGLASSGNSQS